jgi:outer membrane protein TolC
MLDALGRRFAFSLCAAGGALLAGCDGASALVVQYLNMPGQPVAVSHAPSTPAPPPAPLAIVQPVKHESLPSPLLIHESPLIPINLDTVMRLAEDQNRQIALAREKLNASEIEQLTAKSWLPDVYAGIGYYRHEGAIQNEDGTITRSSFGTLFPGLTICTEYDVKEATFRRVDATRKTWQDKAEVTKVTYDTLLDAATTYIDLLAARRGETVGEEIGKYQDALLTRAEKLNTDGSMKFLVEAIKTEIAGRKQAMAKLHQQGDAASMKLSYLLGLPHTTQLVPTDHSFAPIDLVDASPPVDELIHQAVTNGPGVHEMEGLLDTIHGGIAELEGPKKYMPTVGLNAVEGDFGGGPGASMTWGNRFDIGLTAKWNLTEFITARQKRQLAQSKMAQAQLSMDDLQAKLALGVQEARSAILSGQEQVVSSGDMVKHASETYRLSDLRLNTGAPNSSIVEVEQAIRGLELAHVNYLQAIRDYDKAQIRLMLLLGPAACK